MSEAILNAILVALGCLLAGFIAYLLYEGGKKGSGYGEAFTNRLKYRDDFTPKEVIERAYKGVGIILIFLSVVWVFASGECQIFAWEYSGDCTEEVANNRASIVAFGATLMLLPFLAGIAEGYKIAKNQPKKKTSSATDWLNKGSDTKK